MLRCPNCGSDQVRGNKTTLPHGTGWDFWCGACSAVEDAFDDHSDAGAAAVRALRRRWGDLEPERATPNLHACVFSGLTLNELAELAACTAQGRLWERRDGAGRVLLVLDPRIPEETTRWRAWQPGTRIIERGNRAELLQEVELRVRAALSPMNEESHRGDVIHQLRLAHVGLLAASR